MRFRFNTTFATSPGEAKKPPFRKGWLFVILICLCIPHWFNFKEHVLTSMAPDLLLRTIGSRLQEAGNPVYSYHWKAGDPVTWMNPYPDLRIGVNGVVSTPFLLWLLQPFARLDYCTIKLWWGIIQELFLFATILISCLLFKTRVRQLAYIAVTTIFFIYNNNWLLNLYNGQLYVIHAFVFALAAYIMQQNKNGRYAAILLFIFTSTIRPFFVTALVPVFKFSKKYFLLVSLGVALTGFLILVTTEMADWKQYNGAMKIYALEQTREISVRTGSNDSLLHLADACTINPEAHFTIFGAGCLYSLQHYLFRFGIAISNIQFYQTLLLVALISLWWFSHKRRWLEDLPKQLVLAFIFYQLCELLTPAHRNPYNMIQWLPAVAWLFVWGDKKALLFLVAGICLNNNLPFRFAYQREIGEMIMFYSLALFLFKKPNRLVLN